MCVRLECSTCYVVFVVGMSCYVIFFEVTGVYSRITKVLTHHLYSRWTYLRWMVEDDG